jgi:hypothetical protein
MAGAFTSQATTEPWKEQIPYLAGVEGDPSQPGAFKMAQNLYAPGGALTLPGFYPDETVAGFDPYQTMAQESLVNYATGERPAALQSAAEVANLGQMYGQTPFTGQQRADLLAGNVPLGAGTPFNLMGNALQQQVLNQLTGKTLPGIRQSLVDYQPGGSTRGNMLQQQAISDAVTKGMTMPLAQMYTDAYSTAQGQRFPMAQMELGQRAAGLGAYPSIMGAPMGMYEAIGDVGAQRRAMSQELINQAQQRYNYEAQRPANALQNYLASISGAYGGRSTATPSAVSAMGQLAGLITGMG